MPWEISSDSCFKMGVVMFMPGEKQKACHEVRACNYLFRFTFLGMPDVCCITPLVQHATEGAPDRMVHFAEQFVVA